MSDIRKRSGKKGPTYQVRYADISSKTGYSYKTFETKKEALAFREDAQSHQRTGPLSKEINTVAQGMQKWLDVCEKEGRDGKDPVTDYTLKNYEWRRDHIIKYPWSKELHELTSPDIVEFRSWLLENHSRAVAVKLLSSFHSMVIELIKRGVLSHDFVKGVSIRTTSRYDVPVVIPTEDEILSLLRAADTLANSKNKQTQKSWERYRAMLYLAVDTGMRPQEYIVVPTFNILENEVKVDRALERGNKKISVTKTQAGRRFIDLTPDIRDMVLRYAAEFPVKNNDCSLVFPTDTGHWQSTDNWRKRGFCWACKEAGLMDVVEEAGQIIERPRYSPYDLRHFYASMQIENRVNLKRLQKLMGHEKIETTLNVYGHLIERVESKAERRTGMLGSLLAKPQTPPPSKKACGKSVAKRRKPAEIQD